MQHIQIITYLKYPTNEENKNLPWAVLANTEHGQVDQSLR